MNCRALVVCAVAAGWVTLHASPGVVNFYQGNVALDSHSMNANPDQTTLLNTGQILRVADGRAEVLLTPGVFVRIGSNSDLKMVADSDAGTKIELLRGQAVVEVDYVPKAGRIDFMDSGSDSALSRSGIYYFDATRPSVATYRGRLRVDDDGRGIEVGQGEELLLNTNGAKPQKFDLSETRPLYSWSAERAGYSAGVSEWTEEALAGLDGAPTYKDGWYWNPWFKSWAYVPEKGYVLTPFGYGIYAPQTPHSLTPSFGDFRAPEAR